MTDAAARARDCAQPHYYCRHHGIQRVLIVLVKQDATKGGDTRRYKNRQ